MESIVFGQVHGMEDGVLRNGQQSGRHQHAAHNHANGKVLTLEVELLR